MKRVKLPIDKAQDYVAALVQLVRQGRKDVNGLSIQEAIKRAKESWTPI